MSVKSIFKTLVGTIFLMVTISVFVEFFNVSISGMQLRQMTKMAARQACILFTQETYKTDSSRTQGAALVSNVVAPDGTLYISGDFYGGRTSMRAIWNSIYLSDNFQRFCDSSGMYASNRVPSGYSSITDAYPDLDILQNAAKYQGNAPIPSVPDWDAGESEVLAYTNALKANAYYEAAYTTVNIGVPYIDDEIVNKMFKWNVAQILSNCDPDSIQIDEDGEYFINYKGFRCYAQAAKIHSYEYKTYDLTNSSDAMEFYNKTGITTKEMASLNVKGISTTANSDGRVDNNLVTVVGINYRIPISYVGITPIKRIFNYVWDNEVAGLDGTVDGTLDGEWANEKLASVDNGTADGIEYLQAGGINGNNSGGLFETVGSLEYTLIR